MQDWSWDGSLKIRFLLLQQELIQNRHSAVGPSKQGFKVALVMVKACRVSDNRIHVGVKEGTKTARLARVDQTNQREQRWITLPGPYC